MIFNYLDENNFYMTFLKEIIEIQCGKHYNERNQQHIKYLKHYIHSLYECSGVAICVFLNENTPVGFIYVLHDKGLENVACMGKKASIPLFAVKVEYRNKGYGKLLCKEAEKYARQRGA